MLVIYNPHKMIMLLLYVNLTGVISIMCHIESTVQITKHTCLPNALLITVVFMCSTSVCLSL